MAVDEVEKNQPTATSPNIRSHWSLPSFRTIKKKCAQVADVASHMFNGIRYTHDFLDPKKLFLSKKITFLISHSTTVDCYFVPAHVAVVVNEVISLFSMNSLAEKVHSLMSLTVAARDILQASATVCSFLNEISVVSEAAIFWIEKFNVVTLFVDFICIGKSAVGYHHSYKVLSKLRKRCSVLKEHEAREDQLEIALSLLQKIEKKKNNFSEDLYLSKKALDKKIALLRQGILEKKMDVYRDVDAFFALLAHRATINSHLAVADLVTWVVSSGGAFLGFAPGFQLASGLIVAGSGVASFLLWGGKMVFFSRNPFGL